MMCFKWFTSSYPKPSATTEDTWRQSQDACALSRHCEPCKQSFGSQARNSQENRPFLTASGVGTRSPPGPLLLHEERPWICTPANARSPITAGWTGGAGGRQRKKPDGKLPELVLNSGGPEALSQEHNNYTTHTTTTLHTHTYTHAHIHKHIPYRTW